MKTKIFNDILIIAAIWPFMISAQEGLLNLSYQEFDQTPNQGWRSLAEEQGYLQAGEMIDRYLENNNNLEKWQIINLSFHSGQMYAFSDNYDIALLRFRNSINENEPVDTPILWNTYVNATIAFLEKDQDTLIEMRDKIASGPEFQGIIANLDIANKLIRDYGQSYSEAYLSE